MRLRFFPRVIVFAAMLWVAVGPAMAEVTTIEASKDNTLYESAQGTLSNGSGDYIFAGRTSTNGVRRAVIAFNDLSSIPAGSTIDSVRLHIRLSREVSPSTTLRVWRLVSDWGEGASNAGGAEGGGAAAAQDDATWIHTFFDSQTWVSPGGDFMNTASAELEVDAVGSYTVESTEALVNDVQEWLDDPETNFGWILTAGESATTAKRFNSRENPDAASRPMIEVTYTPPEDETNNNWSGAWFDTTLDGEGFQVFDTPVGWIIYYFGYSPDGNHYWLVSEVSEIGDPVLDQSYYMKMMVGTPGSFNSPTPSDQLVEWGQLAVNFESCSKGVFVLESTSLQLLKISSVIKIIGVDGAGCVD
jgi:hypothetical protein